MHRATSIIVAVVPFAVLVSAYAFLQQSTSAQTLSPRDERAYGSFYAGLELGRTECQGFLRVPTRQAGVVRCTHGADKAPPLFSQGRATTVKASQNSPMNIQCDGDGVSGKRVQVIYAHASNLPDNFSTYAITLISHVVGMDVLYDTSASQTGGARHLRFVHDANCIPIILDVTLTPTGTLNLLNTITELEAQGYNSTDRKYVVFMDTAGPCGISIMSFDDSWTGQNANNIGDTFGLIYQSCWSDVIAAHELMHQLGAVQTSAPHSTSDHHCFDGFDNMCRPTDGTPEQVICTYPGAGNLFDCNHDDYFSTDPAPAGYLDKHWNTATSQFFILPPVARVGLLQTLGQSDSGLVATDMLSYTHTVYVHAHIVDQYNLGLQNASVGMSINESNGNPLCAFNVQTDANGVAEIVCALSGSLAQPLTARVNSFSYSNFPNDLAHSSLTHSFTVRWGVLFPLVTR